MQETGREPNEESVWSVLEVALIIRCTSVCVQIGRIESFMLFQMLLLHEYEDIQILT